MAGNRYAERAVDEYANIRIEYAQRSPWKIHWLQERTLREQGLSASGDDDREGGDALIGGARSPTSCKRGVCRSLRSKPPNSVSPNPRQQISSALTEWSGMEDGMKWFSGGKPFKLLTSPEQRTRPPRRLLTSPSTLRGKPSRTMHTASGCTQSLHHPLHKPPVVRVSQEELFGGHCVELSPPRIGVHHAQLKSGRSCTMKALLQYKAEYLLASRSHT